jgi:chitosanase
MNQQQIVNAMKITSIFENGTTDLQYDYAEALSDYKKRGITFSLGFCTRTGDGIQVLTAIMNANKNHPLVKYINPVQKCMDSSFYNRWLFPKKQFIDDWNKYGNYPECVDASNKIYKSECVDPALDMCQKMVFKNFWLFFAIFDCCVMQGVEACQSILDDIVLHDDDAIVLKRFTDRRTKYMEDSGDSEWAKCLYRPNVIQSWAEANWENQDGPYSLSDENVGEFAVYKL